MTMYSSCNTLNGWVSPFGNLRIKANLPAPRSLSQAITSFVACNRQGIHHMHLVTCPYNFDSCTRVHAAGIDQGLSIKYEYFALRRLQTTFLSSCELAN